MIWTHWFTSGATHDPPPNIKGSSRQPAFPLLKYKWASWDTLVIDYQVATGIVSIFLSETIAFLENEQPVLSHSLYGMPASGEHCIIFYSNIDIYCF